METIKKAYDEILKILKKHKDVCVFNIDDLERKANLHLFGVELKEKHGLNVEPKQIYSLDWIRFGDYKGIGYFGEKYNRMISWSDDRTQPTDELLFCISFPTGAYIFGGDYPTEFFQKFFLELKTYKPKYVDTANKSLYFSMDNASEIFNNFDAIMRKYYELNKEDIKQRQILKMKADLEKLEKSI